MHRRPHHPARRRLVAAVVLAAGVVGAVVAVDGRTTPPAGEPRADCGAGRWLVVDGQPPMCAHEDTPPPGIDVTDRVPTAELREREGAGPQAHEAAEDLGVPTTAAAGTASPSVPCDGDGESGYRTQAMYVVEADDANRYAALLPNLRIWAAGVDDVVNRSAALTGGVRRVRFVTDPSGGACVARVLNVTVPAGALATFSSSITALKAQGFDQPTRKYLVWADARALCGVASTYPYATDGQGNPNNGYYPQYARIDQGCWGLGDGGGQSSVEAHELVHTLGAVVPGAPHGTAAGHCRDESDTMCYADGAGVTMQQVCAPTSEYLLDCRGDDYFSTFPDPGSWLDTHWNAADSRFLVGGGDGTGGGTLGAPTVLGATLSVNNPAVPGLPTQATVSPLLPAGRTVAAVTWKAGRSDCTFTQPTQASTEVVCSAASATATTVTATVRDSTGATRSVGVPLTFAAPATPRPVTVGLSTAAQDVDDAATASVCTGAPTDVVATVVDVASGRPVKGLRVALTRDTATTSPVVAGTVLTATAGTAALRAGMTVPTTWSAATTTATGFAAGSSATQTAVPARCAPVLTASASPTTVWYGEPVTLTGTLLREVDVAGQTVPVPVAGAALPVTLTTTSTSATGVVTSRTTTLATATVRADGSWSATVTPTASGVLAVSLAATTAYEPRREEPGPVVVRVPATAVTGTAARLDPFHGDAVPITGRLTADRDGVVTGVAGATVSVLLTPPGGAPTTLATARTAADGTYAVSPPQRLAGALTVRYAGAPGLPAASAAVGTVSVRLPATSLSAAATLLDVPYGGTTRVTGRLVQDRDGTVTGVGGASLQLRVTPPGKSPVVVGTAVTLADGTFAATPSLRVASGTLTAVFTGTPGLPTASAEVGPVVVGAWTPAPRITAAPSSAPRGTLITVTGAVTRSYGATTTVAAGVPVRLRWTPSGSSTPVVLASASTSSTGAVSFRVPTPVGAGALTLAVTGVVGHADAVSPAHGFTGT